MSIIHDSAIVDPNASIGAGVQIGPGAIIEKDVEIGDDCIIGPYALVHRYTTLGAGCRLHAHASLGDIPQDLSFQDAPTYLKVGSGSVFRESVTVHRGAKEGSSTVVGDHCFFMAYSHAGHNALLGNNIILANGVQLAGHVEVGDQVFFGGGSMVHQFCKVGRMVMVGGMSALSKDCPPFCMVPPRTLNQVGGLNVIGMRRNGVGPEDRKKIKEAYKLLFRSGQNVSQARETLLAAFSDGPAAEFAAFIEASTRGLCSDTGDLGE